VTARARPRLALVVPNLVGGGGVQAVARFIKDAVLRSDKFDLRVVSLPESSRDPASLRLMSPQSWLRGPQAVNAEWDGLRISHAGAMGAEFEFQRYRPRRVLSRFLAGCDVIQVVGGFPAWANAALGRGKPVAIHFATLARLERRLRDAEARTAAGRWRRMMTSLADRSDIRALRGVDAIQVMNPSMLEYAKALNIGREVDIQYLPPGVNTQTFRPNRANASSSHSYILSVGRFHDPRKSIGVLLEAFAQLSNTVERPVRLVLAGPTPPPEPFWQRAGTLGLYDRITYIDRPDAGALLRLYQEASVFALSSDEEGFGMVLLESMACGVPVVSTRSGGPDGIITDGEDGYLVPRHDPVALSARLSELLLKPARAIEMGHQARLTIERRYDERVLGDTFIGIWERLAHKAGGA
jgi:glycosyltransferase involved in cell wall biosynthesis